MKQAYKILRTLVLIVIGLMIVIPTLLYVGLELECVQNPARQRAETELTKLLGVNVNIGQVSIAPFNRVTLNHVSLTDNSGDTIAAIHRLGAGVDLYELILRNHLEFGYAEIIGLDGRLSRSNPTAPLNIQPIINALSPKNPNNPKKNFDLAIRTIIIRSSSLRFDVLDQPAIVSDQPKFDANHILVTDLRADIRVPRLRTDDITVDLNRLAFDESTGLSVKSISCKAMFVGDNLFVIDPTIRLEGSELKISSMELPIKGSGSFIDRLRQQKMNIAILSGTHFALNDFRGFVPSLSNLDANVELEADIDGNIDSLKVNRFTLTTTGLGLSFRNAYILNVTDAGKLSATANNIEAIFDGPVISESLQLTGVRLDKNLTKLFDNLGDVNLMTSVNYTDRRLSADGSLLSSPGDIDFDAVIGFPKEGTTIKSIVSSKNFEPKSLLSGIVRDERYIPDEIDLNGDIRIAINSGRRPDGDVHVSFDRISMNGLVVDGLYATAEFSRDGSVSAELECNNDNLTIDGVLGLTQSKESKTLSADIDLGNLSLALLNPEAAKGYLKGRIHTAFEGLTVDNAKGELVASDIHCVKDSIHSFDMKNLTCVVDGSRLPKNIDIICDFADIKISGNYKFSSIAGDVKGIASIVLPSVVNNPVDKNRISELLASSDNSFNVHGKVITTEPIEKMVSLPVKVIGPAEIYATLDAPRSIMAVNINAPYLLQGKKIVENTMLSACIDGHDIDYPSSSLGFSTLFPVKKGKVGLNLTANGLLDRIDSKIRWNMPDNSHFYGDVDLSAHFRRDSLTNTLGTNLHFNPGRAVFNDTVWRIAPSDIDILGKHIAVENFKVEGNGQFLTVNGVASPSPEDSVHLALNDIDLDYVFETLGISNAMFGGRAVGNFYGSALLSGAPRLFTDDLYVKGIKYNHCLMGDAEIRSGWDIDNKAVTIKADITGEHGNISKIDGFIKPLTEELDFKFDADDVPVGFMLPFMEAFTSAIDGHASGNAHLYGTFKYLDMTGDLFARDFKLKLDFTNCWYATTDSIHLRPGRIDIPGVTLRDVYGHTARLDGFVTHRYFKEPEFNFNVSQAQDLLLYDIAESPDLTWYGKIFGNGGAQIRGVPGRIDIDVNVSTAPGSSFAFVLSDAEQAYDYTFITFRDKGADLKGDETLELTPESVRRIREQLKQAATPVIPTAYNMNIAVDVNNNTAVTLVMDPVGGDRIKARGKGNLRMTYSSSDEKLGMFGTYVLSEGSYNFTLQDIIIKDFTIREGSKISFNGDPYSAGLNVEAIYALNANLSDLDESFQQDKELSRTNVPLHALLKVTGDIRQPEISFDLEFPTLTQDTYRKVKSIISTEDMMNRQIIYLLALNRFYTPDYMAGATKGNEFVSVASSTISSQLANILGQLSDNWTIAPSFRSDRGDFSDVEFDVALSSRLLNNRLLFNGNLGYRDKSMNNNSFIGDFDLEYILNRSGSLRLKAYNRYNDRNFYVKSALTTQGVGLMYRRDFDDMFRFLHPRKKKTKSETATPTDSIATPSDSTATPVRGSEDQD